MGLFSIFSKPKVDAQLKELKQYLRIMMTEDMWEKCLIVSGKTDWAMARAMFANEKLAIKDVAIFQMAAVCCVDFERWSDADQEVVGRIRQMANEAERVLG
jgi:hypothetical protein